MKLKFLAIALLVSPLFWAASTRAENPEHVRQLLKTKSCQDCDLTGADLRGVDLSFAILVGADLTGANLTRTNLSNADLTRANLSQTNLSSANLAQAYLTNANLDRTRLVGASLSGTRGVPIMNPPLASLPPLPPRLPRLSPLRIPNQPLTRLPTLPTRPLSRLPRTTLVPPAPTSLPPLPAVTQPTPPPIQPRSETTTTSPQLANIYPPSLVELFMNSCTQQGDIKGVKIEQICGCSINKIQNEYTLDEFMRVALDMAETKKPPQKLVQIATECAIEGLSL